MKIAEYQQMMDYLTGPRERFSNGGRTGYGDGGITLNKKGPYKGFYAITLKRDGKRVTFRDKDKSLVEQKVKEFEATRPPTGGAAVKTKRTVEGVSEKNLTKLREIITNKAKERNLPKPNFKKFPGRGYPSNTPGNIMAKDLIRGIKKTGTRGGKNFKTVGAGSGSKALTDPLLKPQKELLEKTFSNFDFDFTKKSKFGIDRRVNPELYKKAVSLIKENPKLVFGFQFMKPENYLLTQFQRARLQQFADTGVSQYEPIYKNEKIIGFKDNTEVGGGKKFYHADYKGGTSIKAHPNFKKVAKYVDIVKDTRGDHIPSLNKLFTDAGEKVPTFDQLLNNLLDSPGRGGPGSISAAIEKHHTKGVKTATADLQLLTRDKNILAALVEGRVDAGRMDIRTAEAILKPEGIQIDRGGVKIGAPDIAPEKQVKDLKKYVERKTLEKFAFNQDDPLAIRLAALGCGSSRLRSQTGGNPTRECILAGAEKINNPKLIKSGSEARNAALFLNKAAKIGRAVMKFGVIPEAIFAAGASLVGMGQGQSLSESLLRATDYLLPGNQAKMADQIKFEKAVGPENAMTIMRAKDYQNALKELADVEVNADIDIQQNEEQFSGMSDQQLREIKEQRIKQATQNVKNKFVSEAVTDSASRLEMEAEDIAGTNNIFKKIAVAARNSKQDEIENLMAPEQQQKGAAPPLFTIKDFAMGTFSDADLKRAQEKMGAPELTKENLFNDFRGDQGFNKLVFEEIFKDGRSSPAKREQLFGTSGDFFKGSVENMGTPRRTNFIQSPLELYEQNTLIEEGARFGAAGGGIMKIAGKSSGPPPRSGPTPQGLDFLIKRGRQS